MYNPQLETFIRVAEAGSFNKAAEELYITPPAVIKQINLLEAELELTLFVRTHRGLNLTDAGKSLYNDANYVVQYCKDSVTRARNAMKNGDNIIRIGSSPMTPAQSLVELWPKIQEHCPDIKFQIIPFENTPENAREILKNLGQNIDIVAGIFDESLLDYRQCAGTELSKIPICCAVSINHRLSAKDKLNIQDLYGENLLLMRRGWSHYVDLLRDDLWKNHTQIQVIDFSFYNVDIFNQCENSNDIIMAIDNWKYVHPLLKVLPVDWNYTIPFGLLHSPNPSKTVKRFLEAVEAVI
ncbi:LysR family transcriptional regulator [Lacrimispora indolis]|uniref:LysR family transcriptional regulator n=1 Tax=Lacrimispora indolis TaxID=69825 RepID=UPI00040524B0|nr:LysR family transcriptional regulator [[Clostridium] methoxybenzovorans]